MLRLIIFVISSLLAIANASNGGIYPEGHWDYSTKLTTANFDGIVKDNIDKGKTLFVRWIASEG